MKTRKDLLTYEVKTWEELTEEQKEQEMSNHQESIENFYWDDKKYDFDDRCKKLEEIYKIGFNDIYFDDAYGGQQIWLDIIKNIYFNCDDIYYKNSKIAIYDIDYHSEGYNGSFRFKEVKFEDLMFDSYEFDYDEIKKLYNIKNGIVKKQIDKELKRINGYFKELGEAIVDYIGETYASREYYEDFFIGNEYEFEYLIDTKEME